MRSSSFGPGRVRGSRWRRSPGAQSAAAADYVSDQVIVKPQGRARRSTRVARAARRAAARRHASTASAPTSSRVRGNPVVLSRALSRSPLVELRRAELHPAIARATPNDALLRRDVRPEQHGPDRRHAPTPTSTRPRAGTRPGSARSRRSGGPRVGIVDTGIDQAHQDLTGKTVACAQSRGLGGVLGGSIQVGQCADDNDHGTHVAGTISANTNNGVGVAGVAFNSPLVICKALGGPLGTGSTADVANCINWTAQQGAKVISMSLGGGNSSTLKTAVEQRLEQRQRRAADRGRRQRRRLDASTTRPATRRSCPSRPPTTATSARVVLERERGRRDRGAGREHPVDPARRRLLHAVRHVDGDAARVGRGGAAVRPLRRPPTRRRSARSWTRRSTTSAPAGRDSSFGFGRVNLQQGSCGGT